MAAAYDHSDGCGREDGGRRGQTLDQVALFVEDHAAPDEADAGDRPGDRLWRSLEADGGESRGTGSDEGKSAVPGGGAPELRSKPIMNATASPVMTRPISTASVVTL